MSDKFSDLRYRGHVGGKISKHRALLTVVDRPQRFYMAALLSACILVVWALSLDFVASFWGTTMNFWRAVLGMEGNVNIVHYNLGPWIHFNVPFLNFHTGLPTNDIWWAGTMMSAGLVLASILIPNRLLPWAYLMRIVAFFQCCAQLFFAIWPYDFPYRGAGYIHGTMIACMMLITLVPVLLGCTYFVFDFKLKRKIWLTFLTMGHMTVMVPLQYMLQAYIMHHVSLLFLPLLFFVFGLPLNILIFIGFYSWGFSWQDELRERNEPTFGKQNHVLE